MSSGRPWRSRSEDAADAAVARAARPTERDGVPAEVERFRRRISGRDRWFLAVLVAAVLVGTPSAVLLSAGGSSPGTDAGCVSTVRAFIMGGATYTYCGADVVGACRQFAADDSGLAAQCDRLGVVWRR